MIPYNRDLRKAFLKNAGEEKATPMKKYMQDQFDFFGLPSKERREISKEYIKSRPLPDGGEMKEIVMELWTLPEREFQYFGMELFMKLNKKWSDKDHVLIEELIVNKSWWDTVDFLASNIAGDYFKKFPAQVEQVTGKWNQSKNMWLQRTSLLFQLKYKKQTDFILLTRYIEQLSGSKEFFIQKAIGWILREYSKTQPSTVKRFLKEHSLAPLSKREAIKVMAKGEV